MKYLSIAALTLMLLQLTGCATTQPEAYEAADVAPPYASNDAANVAGSMLSPIR